MKCIYVCPNCHTFYASERYKGAEKCLECQTVLVETEINYEVFSSLSSDERESIKKEYIQKNFLNTDSAEYMIDRQDRFVPLPNSGWVSYLNVVAWIELIGFFISGLIMLTSEQAGLGILLILAGAFSSGMVFMMCTIASDVRHIRNQVDRYAYQKMEEN